MVQLTTSYKHYTFSLSAISMGKDWNISIYGGDLPHIGATAIGIPRPSLKDACKISSSVSVITIPGHKEDELIRQVAHRLSSQLNCIISVSGGIHLDSIEVDDFIGIESSITDLCTRFLDYVHEN